MQERERLVFAPLSPLLSAHSAKCTLSAAAQTSIQMTYFFGGIYFYTSLPRARFW